MPTSEPTILVSTAWLHDRLGSPDIRILDASWHLPQTGRSGRSEFDQVHIPGAAFFDIDEIADASSPLPHTMPSPEKFASRVRKLGVGDGTTVIVYDACGMYAAARVWWMFRAMGHHQVAVLDGGLGKWQAEGLPMTDDTQVHFERHFTARPDWSKLRTFDAVQKDVESGDRQILDARSPGRFSGKDPEPREGLKSGHMPGAINIPHSSLLLPDGTLKRPEDLAALFTEAGVDLAQPATATCGSGVSACLVLLALSATGRRDDALYDGSWAEWGSRSGTPVVTGP